MKKRFSLLLTLVLALTLWTPVLAAGEEAAAPAPPSWCPAEEYAVFEGSPIYEPENWEVITRLRWAVAQGGLNLGGLPAELRREYERLQGLRTDGGKRDPGVVFELALVETRMTYTDNNQVTGPYWSGLRYVVEDLPQGLTDGQRYALLMWNARDKLHCDGVCRETCEAVDLLTGYPQFSLDKLISSPVFTAQEQADYRAALPAALSAYQSRVELYLDGRPLAMGAVYWSMGNTERDGGQIPFGIYPRSAAMARELRQSLAESWGVRDRAGLVDTIRIMTPHGHNDSFLEAAALAEGMSQSQWEELLAQSGEVDKYMWPYTRALSEKWGDKGILAWDLARMSALAQWGYGAGYVTYEQALELVEPAARLACEHFDSWEEFCLNWLDGYSWWAREDVAAYAERLEANLRSHNGGQLPEDWKDWYSMPRASYCRYIMDLPVLDETLFRAGVLGLPEDA